jgi:hypothetical protein
MVKFEKRKAVVLFLLFAVSMYSTAYTIAAYLICLRNVVEYSGKVYWNSSPKGSLFPWPRKDCGICIPILIELDKMDLFIYNYLVRTYLLAIVCAALWLLTILVLYKQIKPTNSNI